MKKNYCLDVEEIIDYLSMLKNSGVPCHRTAVSSEAQNLANLYVDKLIENLEVFFAEGEIED